ncbi:hypothetical protein EI94DRAFT_500932 [Lactarius quietus]|nr:hypothetical protein EI94DRAFT_500932 [Lactarius quietus]
MSPFFSNQRVVTGHPLHPRTLLTLGIFLPLQHFVMIFPLPPYPRCSIYIYICLLLLFLFHMISDQCFIAMAVTAMTLSPSLLLAHAGYHRSRRATTPTPSPMQRHSDISLHNRRYHPTVAPSSCRSCNRPRCGQSDVRTAT